MTKLSFGQIDCAMSESFWQKDRMVTHIFFDLCLFKHSRPVANFGNQSIFSIILVASEHQNRFRIIKFRENKIDDTPILKHAMVNSQLKYQRSKTSLEK